MYVHVFYSFFLSPLACVVVERTYPGAEDGIVDPAELYHGRLHHGADAGFVADVDAQGERAEVRVRGEGFACGGGILRAWFVEVGEDEACGTCFGEGEGGFAADACCCLFRGGNERVVRRVMWEGCGFA